MNKRALSAAIVMTIAAGAAFTAPDAMAGGNNHWSQSYSSFWSDSSSSWNNNRSSGQSWSSWQGNDHDRDDDDDRRHGHDKKKGRGHEHHQGVGRGHDHDDDECSDDSGSNGKGHKKNKGRGHDHHQGYGYGHGHDDDCLDDDDDHDDDHDHDNDDDRGWGHKKKKGKGHHDHGNGHGYGHDHDHDDDDCPDHDDDDDNGGDGGDGGDGGSDGGLGNCVATTQMSYSLSDDAGLTVQFPYYYNDGGADLPLFPDEHLTTSYSAVIAVGAQLQASFYAPAGQNISDVQMSMGGQTYTWNDETGFAGAASDVTVITNTNQSVQFLFGSVGGTGNFDFQVTICSEDGGAIDPS